MPISEKKRQFILELTALTYKYGLAIVGGVGAYGEASISEVDTPEGSGYVYDSPEGLMWVSSDDKYYAERFAPYIVKEVKNES